MNKVLQRFSEEPDHRLIDGEWDSLQMYKFAVSLQAYANGKVPPEGCYPGEYTERLAKDLAKTVPLDAPLWIWAKFGGTRVTKEQADDLKVFGCTFDTWKRESDLKHGNTQLLRVLHVSGKLPFTLSNGNEVCGECGHLITYKVPCEFCMSDQSFKGVTREIVCAITGKQDYDPGLHPDNDFIGELYD